MVQIPNMKEHAEIIFFKGKKKKREKALNGLKHGEVVV